MRLNYFCKENAALPKLESPPRRLQLLLTKRREEEAIILHLLMQPPIVFQISNTHTRLGGRARQLYLHTRRKEAAPLPSSAETLNVNDT